MQDYVIATSLAAFFIIGCASYAPAMVWYKRRKRRIEEMGSRLSDADLVKLLAFLERAVPRRNSKAFADRLRITTERLTDAEYEKIETQLYDPDMISSFREQQTLLMNTMAVDAIKRQQIRRRLDGKEEKGFDAR